jgi:hydrogenase expression/formation protein HypC
MCLAIPGELVNIHGHQGEVNFSGVCRLVDLRLVPGAVVGDYLLVHAGCAIQIVPADEALAALELWREIMNEDNDRPDSSGEAANEG